MRVAIFLTTPADVYSGGRYCAFMLAEALAHGGHDSHIVAENEPVFRRDFEVLPSHANVQFHRTRDFRSDLPEGQFDVVVLVPGTGFPGFYLRVQRFAIERGAHLVFLNFESPNWFNALSPDTRPESEWAPWKRWSRDASLVLSISKEGQHWAEKFYTGVSSQTRFDYVYPAINTVAADAVPQGVREDRVLLFTRFTKAKHKGSDRLDALFCEAMRGHTLVFVLGRNDMPPQTLARLIAKANTFGVQIEMREKISDREKFEEIKRAKLVLFPSLFEGFGYPPIEALYCDTPCVAFDLPVLRETCGDHLIFAAHNDWGDFREKVSVALDSGPSDLKTRKEVEGVVSLDALAARLDEALEPLLDMPPVDEARRTSTERWLGLRDTFGLNDPKYRYARFQSWLRRGTYKIVKTILRRSQRLRRRRRRVVYYPAFTSLEELTEHYHRACWYLPRVPGRCEEVCLFHELSEARITPGARPEYMAPPPNPPDHIRLRRGRHANFRMLFAADLVVFWQKNPDRRLMKLLDWLLGIKTAYVATDDLSAIEYGEYCSLVWEHLTSKKQRAAYIQESHERLRRMVEQLKSESIRASCVFGTGPSLENAYDFDFSDTLCIVCNSIVHDEALMDYLEPRFICAGDVISHFGVSSYAHEFRADLINALRNRDIVLLTTAKYGSMILYHYPDLREKILLIEQTRDGPTYDLIADFEAPRLDSTLNIHMLPLAATFSKHVWLLGCDGKDPSGENEDFWAHAERAQYHDLVDSGHRCHPTFDLNRQLSTYGRYIQSIAQTIEGGERRGISYGSLHASFVPSIAQRAVRQSDLDAAVLSAPYRVSDFQRFLPQ